MEVVRNQGPENGFLKKVRKLANDNGIVLIWEMDNNNSPAQANRRSIYGINGEPFQTFSGVFQSVGAYTDISYQYSNMVLAIINGPSFQGAAVPEISGYQCL